MHTIINYEVCTKTEFTVDPWTIQPSDCLYGGCLKFHRKRLFKTSLYH